MTAVTASFQRAVVNFLVPGRSDPSDRVKQGHITITRRRFEFTRAAKSPCGSFDRNHRARPRAGFIEIRGAGGARVLGTPVKAIRDTEDRKLFIERLAEIGVPTARSCASRTADEAWAAARQIGFPVMLRGGFALGGQGSSIAETEADLDQALRRAFAGGTSQVLVNLVANCKRGELTNPRQTQWWSSG